MIGIPFTLMREPEANLGVEKTIYLSTRRSGESGMQMSEARKAYRRFQNQSVRAAHRCMFLSRQVSETATDSSDYARLVKETDDAMAEAATAEEGAVTEAERLIRISLTENYGEKTAADILDVCSDDDLHAMAKTLQMGEQPKDFFQKATAQQKSTPTLPPGATPSASSSGQDSPAEM